MLLLIIGLIVVAYNWINCCCCLCRRIRVRARRDSRVAGQPPPDEPDDQPAGRQHRPRPSRRSPQRDSTVSGEIDNVKTSENTTLLFM